MSEKTLSCLLEYLYGTLTPSNMRWVGEHLIEYANTGAPKPYTIEELHSMVAEGEKQFAEGKWQDSEDMFRELEEEFAAEEPQYAQTV